MFLKRKDKIMEKKHSKEMNFELLRVIAMFFIVLYHEVAHSGIAEVQNQGIINECIETLFLTLGPVFLNLFVMITGYFMVKSKMNLKSIAKLVLETFIYSVSIAVLFALKTKTWPNIRNFFPVSSNEYWYVTAYVAIYLLSPFMNIVLRKINKKQYSVLLALITIFMVIQPSIFYTNTTIINSGLSLIWMVYLYIFAGYIRMHYDKNIKKEICFMISILLVILTVIMSAIYAPFLKIDLSKISKHYSITVVCSTIFMFLGFKQVNLKNKKTIKLLEIISPLTFGVYLIHDNNIIRRRLWMKYLKISKLVFSEGLLIKLILIGLGVYIVCLFIDFARKTIFDAIYKTKLYGKLDNKLDKLNTKFWATMEEGKEN